MLLQFYPLATAPTSEKSHVNPGLCKLLQKFQSDNLVCAQNCCPLHRNQGPAFLKALLRSPACFSTVPIIPDEASFDDDVVMMHQKLAIVLFLMFFLGFVGVLLWLILHAIVTCNVVLIIADCIARKSDRHQAL